MPPTPNEPSSGPSDSDPPQNQSQAESDPAPSDAAQQLLQLFRSRRTDAAVPIVLNQDRPAPTPSISNSPSLLIAPVVLDPTFSSREPVECLGDTICQLYPSARFEEELPRRAPRSWGRGIANYIHLCGDERERVLVIDRFQDILSGEVGTEERDRFMAALRSLSEIKTLTVICFTSVDSLSATCAATGTAVWEAEVPVAPAAAGPVANPTPEIRAIAEPAAKSGPEAGPEAETEAESPASPEKHRKYGILAIAAALPSVALAVVVCAVLFLTGRLEEQGEDERGLWADAAAEGQDDQSIDLELLMPRPKPEPPEPVETPEAVYVGETPDSRPSENIEPPKNLRPVSSTPGEPQPAPEPEPEPIPQAEPEPKPEPAPKPEVLENKPPAPKPEASVDPASEIKEQPKPAPEPEPEPEPHFLDGLSQAVSIEAVDALSVNWRNAAPEDWQRRIGAESPEIALEIGRRYAATNENHALHIAAWWFERAAAAGEADGAYEVGRCLLFGEGVDQDPETAFETLFSAHEDGCEPAAYLLGICETYGIGREEARPSHGRFFLQRAGEAGVAEAWFELGLLYESDALGEPNLAWACKMFRNGAEAGHRQCMLRAAEYFEAGEVITRDLKKAGELREQAKKAERSAVFDRVREMLVDPEK